MRNASAGFLALVGALFLVAAAPAFGLIDAGALKNAQVATTDLFINGNGDNTGGGVVNCPHGTRVLTGGAFWQPGHQGPDSMRANLVALWSSSPTHDGKRWFAAGFNGSAGKLNLTVVVRCLATEKLAHVQVMGIANGVSNGVGNATSDPCPAGTRVLTGGVFWTDHFGGEKPDASIAPDANLLWSSPTLDDRSLDTGWSNHSGGNEKFLSKELRCLGG